MIASGHLKTVEIAMEMIKKGADPLDAVIAGVAIVEADPNDHSVGLGGTPNEDGVVELDAAVMHGRTHGGAGVAGLRNIMHPAAVARTIMKKTRHVLLVGDNALKFAKEQGFPETDLLTEDTRRAWLAWKEAVPRLTLPGSVAQPSRWSATWSSGLYTARSTARHRYPRRHGLRDHDFRTRLQGTRPRRRFADPRGRAFPR